jgi:hypothetical protein
MICLLEEQGWCEAGGDMLRTTYACTSTAKQAWAQQ